VRHLSFLAALPLPVVPVAVVPIAPLLPLPPPLGAGVLGAGALAAAALGAGAAGAAPLKPAVETAVAMAPYFESMPEPSDRSPATATSARHASSNAYSARSWAGSSAANRPRKRSVVSLASGAPLVLQHYTLYSNIMHTSTTATHRRGPSFIRRQAHARHFLHVERQAFAFENLLIARGDLVTDDPACGVFRAP
jgi:hypothetical protein